MNALDILVGSDPEVFVKQGVSFVTGHGLIKGDKKNPYKVNCGAVQVDGMALEFNIDPANSEAVFIHNIQTVMKQLQEMVPNHELCPIPVARFGKEYLATMPEAALELGCDPDFNAYTGDANPRPDGDVDFRTGGGHVHVGWTTDMDLEDVGHREAAQMLAKELDFYLGLPSLFWDKEDGRRAMYGKAGAYRIKHFGMEYRSLSNAWVSDPRLMSIVYKNTKLAVDNLMNGVSMAKQYGKHIERAINNSNRDLAKAVLRAADGEFEGELQLPDGYEEHK